MSSLGPLALQSLSRCQPYATLFFVSFVGIVIFLPLGLCHLVNFPHWARTSIWHHGLFQR